MENKKHFIGTVGEKLESTPEPSFTHEETAKKFINESLEKENVNQAEIISKLLNTTIKPLEDRVIVYPDPVERVTAGGILKPDEVVKKERPARGTVIAVGPGLASDTTLTNKILITILDAMELITGKKLGASELKQSIKDKIVKLEKGDRIIYGRFAGTGIDDPETKVEVLIMRPVDIFTKL